MFEDVKNQQQTQAKPRQVKNMPPLASSQSNQVPDNTQMPNVSGGSSKKKLIIAIIGSALVIAIFVGGYFLIKNNDFFGQEKQNVVILEEDMNNVSISDDSVRMIDDQDAEEKNDPKLIDDNLEPINNDELTVAELLGDYTRSENLPSLIICYLYKNPTDIQYFPDGLKDEYSFSKNWTSESDKNEAESMCKFFGEGSYEYYLSLLQTDEDKDGLNLYLEKLYHADDTKADTDDDGHDDLTEVLNGYNPNDILANDIGSKFAMVEEVMQAEGDFDQDKALEICRSIEMSTAVDSCLDTISNRVTDDDFCATAGFSDTTTLKFRCEQNVMRNQAIRDDDATKCLDLSQPDYCLAIFGKNNKTLEPCALDPDTFIFCAVTVYNYLDDPEECRKYKADMLEGDYFNSCMVSVAINTKDVSICDELTDANWCRESVNGL